MSSTHKVLVAEPDEIILALLSHILKRQGYAVDLALTLAEAVQCMQLKRYDAHVIDAKLLAALDGFADRRARSIVLGKTDVSGVHAVLPKPIEFGSLVETVAACVK